MRLISPLVPNHPYVMQHKSIVSILKIVREGDSYDVSSVVIESEFYSREM